MSIQDPNVLIDCRGLQVGYDGVAMLPPIEVDVHRGVFCVVVGRNGSGKSTWFKTVLGLIPPVSGQVMHAPGLKVAYIPQRLHYDPIYPLTAINVVRMGALNGFNFWGSSGLDYDELKLAMDAVDVWKLRDQSFRSLSEGQKQRVLFARALVSRPEVAFMDEPTSAMDVVAEREMLSLVDRVRRDRKMAVVMVTHELSVAAEYAEQVIFVDRTSRTVLAGTPREVLGHEQFARLYGQEKAHELLVELDHFQRRKAGGPHT
ncbi:MAG: metal ABC transporter ATP-binding protein [Myxococcota bacterium]